MKKSLIVGLVAELSASTLGFAAEKHILLSAGLQQVIKIKYDVCANLSECIKVGNINILSVQYSPSQHEIILTPLKAGETTITVRDKSGSVADVYEVAVSNVNLARMSSEISDLLKDVKGVTVKAVPHRIIVDGEVTKVDDLNRIRRVVFSDQYHEIAMSLVRPSPALKQSIAEQVQKELKAGDVTVKPFGESYVLEGSVSDATVAAQLVQTAKQLITALHPALTGEPVISRLTIGQKAK